eukprot:GILJ01006526.1.p1 GENE.GILJ01006526.1~~GILJ01006526.1.p1  ORF type:complete len:423 (-),score=118.82 GILJ01006526.1:157-1425(-)
MSTDIQQQSSSFSSSHLDTKQPLSLPLDRFVLLKNLNKNLNINDVKMAFSTVGDIDNVFDLGSSEMGKTFALLFDSTHLASTALLLNGSEFMGSKLNLEAGSMLSEDFKNRLMEKMKDVPQMQFVRRSKNKKSKQKTLVSTEELQASGSRRERDHGDYHQRHEFMQQDESASASATSSSVDTEKWKNMSDKMSDKVIGAMQSFKTKAADMSKNQESLGEKASHLKDWAMQKGQEMKEKLPTTGSLSEVMDTVSDKISHMMSSGKNAEETMEDESKMSKEEIEAKMESNKGLMDRAKQAASGAVEMIKDTATTLKEQIQDNLPEYDENAKPGFLQQGLDVGRSATTMATEKVKETMGAAKEVLSDRVHTARDSVMEVLSNAAEKMGLAHHTEEGETMSAMTGLEQSNKDEEKIIKEKQQKKQQ